MICFILCNRILAIYRLGLGADNGIRTRPNCLGSSYATATSYPQLFLKNLLLCNIKFTRV